MRVSLVHELQEWQRATASELLQQEGTIHFSWHLLPVRPETSNELNVSALQLNDQSIKITSVLATDGQELAASSRIALRAGKLSDPLGTGICQQTLHLGQRLRIIPVQPTLLLVLHLSSIMCNHKCT
jgi:hypothetical protein